MLELALAFIVLAVLAYIAGLRGLAGFTMGIARLLIFVFLVLAILQFVL